eukprot:jgi/Sobl393_1/19738/SZX66078.1
MAAAMGDLASRQAAAASMPPELTPAMLAGIVSGAANGLPADAAAAAAAAAAAVCLLPPPAGTAATSSAQNPSGSWLHR